MEKRYQVFVSSTYEDLKEERREVIQALLELDCIPAGMELFSADDDDQWHYITDVIDQCDYYIVIVADRYGCLCSDGKSYTQKEYEYALKSKIPIAGFVHSKPGGIPNDKCENDPDKKAKLQKFREAVKGKICKGWDNSDNLASAVSRSIASMIKRHPRTGWVRADKVAADEANTEILTLKRKIEELESSERARSTEPPPGTEDLAQGEDTLAITYSASVNAWEKMGRRRHELFTGLDVCEIALTTWNNLFTKLGPHMIMEESEGALESLLHKFYKGIVEERVWAEARHQARQVDTICGGEITVDARELEFAGNELGQVLLQLVALGLIEPGDEERMARDGIKYWKLTPFGRRRLAQVGAIRKTDRTNPGSDEAADEESEAQSDK